MKTANMYIQALVAAMLMFAMGTRSHAAWTRSGNTITDANGWVLKVENAELNGVSGISLTIDAVSTKGTPATVLDLSGEISDGSTIVGLNNYSLRSSSAGLLHSVTLPDTLIQIGEFAFTGQTSLTNVVPLLPSSVKIVGQQSFWNVPIRGVLDLTSVTNLAAGHSHFRNTSITSVVFGTGLRAIPGYSFLGCASLRSVVFAEGLESMGSVAFSGCGALSEIENALPSTFTSFIDGDNYFASIPYAGDVNLTNPEFVTVPYKLGFPKANDFHFGVGLSYVSDYAFDAIGANSRAWDIHFRGGVPVFATVKSQVFRSTSDWKLRVFYPEYDDASGGWREWVAANTTPLTEAQTNAYVASYPGETFPVGRGNAGTIFANEYLVPWTPPTLATNALHIVGSLTRSISGAGEPAGDAVSPAYGVVEGIADGDTVACSAPAVDVLDGIGYGCAGYVLETLGATGWGDPVTNMSASSFAYVQSGSEARRLTWLWEPVGFTLEITMPDVGEDAVTRTVQPDSDGIYLPGTVVQLTALVSASEPASVFRRWHGDVPAGQNPESVTIAVTMDSPKTLIPEFVRDWIYTSGNPATIRDGYWTLKVAGAAATLGVGSWAGSVSSPIGSLDLDKPISNGGTIVSVAGFANNYKLGDVRLPSGLKTIGSKAFTHCTSLTNVVPFLPDTVTSVDYQAFMNCPIENRLILTNSSPMTYGESCFAATKVKSVLFGEGTTHVGTRMFENAKSLGEVVFPNTVTQIRYNGFNGCSGLTNIAPCLPLSLVSLDNAAFNGVPITAGHLELVGCIPASLKGEYTFAGSRIETATLWVDTLTTRCFQSCTNLRQLFLIGEKPAFGWGPFVGLPNYQVRIYVPRSSETWQAYADADNVRALTDIEKTQFQTDYPGERLPLGTWVPPNSGRQWYCTWVPPKDQLRTTVIIVR